MSEKQAKIYQNGKGKKGNKVRSNQIMFYI